ncbi:MAG: molybdopterin-dependent oxidoreductase, partial [Dehalococcoidia bacterium]|nr:molybdopterin-dependent oxidoreductase [Dehalococcoidia bacterium]
KGIRALEKVEFVVVHDQFLTSMARHADIVLPVSSHFEREDVQIPHGQGNYLIFNRQVIEPLDESKSDLDILTALAQRIGGGAFGDKTAQEWLPELIKHAPVGYEDLRTQDVFRNGTPVPQTPLQEFVADPQGNPLPTPSGKVEIFSQALAQRQQALLPPLPQYIADPEPSPPQPSYPFLLVTVHSRKSVHSSFYNIPWLQEIEPHILCMNPVDATAQGVDDGQKVIVRSEIGAVVITAKLTERIMPGVVSIPQGAWYQLDEKGLDWSGSVNVLCPDDISPGEASVTNAVRVTVARWES